MEPFDDSPMPDDMSKNKPMPYCFTSHSKLEEFRSDGKYTDVNIKVQDRTFKCHRVVLASAAEYFNSMFGGCFKEGRTENLILHEIDPTAFDTILKCVYSGCAPAIDENNVLNLLRASNLLGMDAVKDGCVAFILQNVQLISSLEAFGIAYAQDNVKLLDSLSEHIVRHLENFVNKGMFLDMHYDELNILLSRYRSSSLPFLSEDFLLDALIRWVYYSSAERKDYFVKLLEMINFERISSGFLEYMKEKYKVDAQAFEKSSSDRVCESSSLLRRAVVDSLMLHNESADNYDALPIFYKDLQFTSNTLHAISEVSETSKRTKYTIFSRDKSRAKPEWYDSCKFYKPNCGKYQSPVEGLVTLEKPDYLYTYERTLGSCWLFNAYSSINFSSKPHATLTFLPLDEYSKPRLVGAGQRIYLYEQSPNIVWTKKIGDKLPEFRKNEYERGIFYYNCDIDKWFPVPEMKTKVSDSYLWSDHKLVYLIGGKDTNKIRRPHYVQAYDYRTPQWLEIPSTLTSPHGSREAKTHLSGRLNTRSCCAANGKIYLANHDLIQAFDPVAFKWEKIKEYSRRRVMIIAADNESSLIVYHYFPYSGTNKFEFCDLTSLEWNALRSMDSLHKDMIYHDFSDIVVFKPLAQ